MDTQKSEFMAFCVQAGPLDLNMEQPVRIITVEPDKLKLVLTPFHGETRLEVVDHTDRQFSPITVSLVGGDLRTLPQSSCAKEMFLKNRCTYTIQYTSRLHQNDQSITLAPASQLSIQSPCSWQSTPPVYGSVSIKSSIHPMDT